LQSTETFSNRFRTLPARVAGIAYLVKSPSVAHFRISVTSGWRFTRCSVLDWA